MLNEIVADRAIEVDTLTVTLFSETFGMDYPTAAEAAEALVDDLLAYGRVWDADAEDQAAELVHLAAAWDAAAFWASPEGISLWLTEPPAADAVLDGDLPSSVWLAAVAYDYREPITA